MIESIFIKNFKKFDRKSFSISQHNLLIGENDSGKSTILQALDIFFNQEKIDKSYVRNVGQPVEIGIMYNGKQYKRIYTGATYKVSEEVGDFNDLSSLKYIYIPSNFNDVNQLITQLSVAKALENTDNSLIEQLKDISQNSINDVLSGVDDEFFVLNNTITELVGEQKFKYDASLKFDVTYNGVSVYARGSGFQKNLLYALIIGNQYDNVILGVDEIENSFSINNSKNMILKIHEKIGQTLISTHSKQIVKVSNNANIISLFSENNTSLIELLQTLDPSDDKNYLIVEGVFDLPWIKKSLELLGLFNNYIVLPAGGCDNIEHLCGQLNANGLVTKIVKDGDTNDNFSLTLDCIELYTPVELLNDIFRLSIEEIPNNKDDFFDLFVDNDSDYVKNKISRNIHNYLTLDNPLNNDIKRILDSQ